MICIADIFSVCTFCCNFDPDSFCYREFFSCSLIYQVFFLLFNVTFKLLGLCHFLPALPASFAAPPFVTATAGVGSPAWALLPAWNFCPDLPCSQTQQWRDSAPVLRSGSLIMPDGAHHRPCCGAHMAFVVRWGSLHTPVSGHSTWSLLGTGSKVPSFCHTGSRECLVTKRMN